MNNATNDVSVKRFSLYNRFSEAYWKNDALEVIVFETKAVAIEYFEEIKRNHPIKGFFNDGMGVVVPYPNDEFTKPQLNLRYAIFNEYAQEYWIGAFGGPLIFLTKELAEEHLEDWLTRQEIDANEAVIEVFNQDKIIFTRNNFMDFFRNTDALNTLSVDDRHEVFRTIMPGSSDFTVELLQSVLSDYSVGDISVTAHVEKAVKHTETATTISCGHCGREYCKYATSKQDLLKLGDSANQCLDDDCPGPQSVTLGNMRNETELRINATLSNDDEGLDEDKFRQLVLDVQGLYAAHGKDIKVFARQDAPFVVDVD
jgi:hypothetical protein